MESTLKIEGYELLSQKIYWAIKSEIIKGSLKPGTKLSENKIAEQLGVSRTPIREALKELATAGFVKMIPNQVIIVSDISIKDLREVLQIRGALEGLAARLAVGLIDDEKIDALENCNKNMKKILGQNDVLAFSKESDRFHEIILSISGNDRLVKVWKNLSEQIHRFRNISLHIPGRMESALKEHKEIAEALKQRDADRADAMSQKHIASVLKNILPCEEKS